MELRSVTLPGSFNDWDLEAAPLSLTRSGGWTIEILIDQPGPIEFKFAANGTWDVNGGELEQTEDALPLTGTAVLNTENNNENIRAFIPQTGLYRFTIDPETFAYSVRESESPAAEPEALIGSWEIEWAPTTDGDPQPRFLTIESTTDHRLTGSFDDRPIEAGRWTNSRGRLQFTFTTRDDAIRYHSTGRMERNQLSGTTHSPARDFFSAWGGRRMEVQR
ncbi:MAG: hypothetical protein AAF514_22295 [Verrucomicrobiota bacterium]